MYSNFFLLLPFQSLLSCFDVFIVLRCCYVVNTYFINIFKSDCFQLSCCYLLDLFILYHRFLMLSTTFFIFIMSLFFILFFVVDNYIITDYFLMSTTFLKFFRFYLILYQSGELSHFYIGFLVESGEWWPFFDWF